jgi:hypothetical protein
MPQTVPNRPMKGELQMAQTLLQRVAQAPGALGVCSALGGQAGPCRRLPGRIDQQA